MKSTLFGAARACAQRFAGQAQGQGAARSPVVRKKRFIHRAGERLAAVPGRPLIVAGIVQGAATTAYAGAGGTEFQTVYDQVSGWTNGVLGKTLAVSSLLVGLGIGVIKQSVMSAVVGVGMALVAGFGPSAIDGVITVGHAVVVPI